MPNNPFVINDELSFTVEKLIRLDYGSKAINNICRTFYPYELTGCERKIIYRTIGNESELPYTNAEQYSEQYLKNKWFSILDRTNGIKLLDKYVTASESKFNIVSKIDCVIEIASLDNLQIVVNIKSLPSLEFNYIKNNGVFRNDVIITVIDMWLIEITHGIIIYENRDNLDFMIFRILPHNAIINSIKSKAKKLYEYKLRGEIPDRPYKTNNSKECRICGYFKTCWI